MMPRAFVFFIVDSASENQVLHEVRKIDGVQEANILYGAYDLVVKIKTDSLEQLKELVTHRLRRVEKVRSTLTLILAEE